MPLQGPGGFRPDRLQCYTQRARQTTQDLADVRLRPAADCP